MKVPVEMMADYSGVMADLRAVAVARLSIDGDVQQCNRGFADLLERVGTPVAHRGVTWLFVSPSWERLSSKFAKIHKGIVHEGLFTMVPGPDSRSLRGALMRDGNHLHFVAEHDPADWHRSERLFVDLNRELAEAHRRLAAELAGRHRAEAALKERSARLDGTNRELEHLVVTRTRELEQRTNQLRRLANHLVFAEHRERTRLARILHDDLQQMLSAATIRFDLVQQQSREPGIGDELAAIRDILDEAAEAARSLSHELSPPALENGRLADVLQWQARWMESHHRLRTELSIEEDLPRVSYETKILLLDAMRELLFNAVKHAEVERCSVGLYVQENQLCLSIEDAGKGFEPRDVEATGHHGLGLFSIRERVEAMGGRIEIESAPGKGSRFRLYLPVGQTRIAEPASFVVESPRAAEAPSHEGMIRLLIVDDHPIVRDGLISMIRRSRDMKVVGEASDGEEAIELSELLKPDVVVMDIHMPRVDGLEATREIKRRQPDVRVIGLSVLGEEAAGEEMVRAGASAFLPKGAPSDVFFQTLRKIMAVT